MKCHEFYAVFSLLFLIWKSVLRYNNFSPIMSNFICLLIVKTLIIVPCQSNYNYKNYIRTVISFL